MEHILRRLICTKQHMPHHTRWSDLMTQISPRIFYKSHRAFSARWESISASLSWARDISKSRTATFAPSFRNLYIKGTGSRAEYFFIKTCKLKSVSCIFALMVFKLSGFLFVKKIKYTKLLIVSVKTLIDFRHGTLFKKLVAAQKPAYLLYYT